MNGLITGSYRNIAYAQAPFDRRITQVRQTGIYESHYLGYHEVRGKAAIGPLVDSAIPDKATPIYIVGHSPGAWSGAHLSHRLMNGAIGWRCW